VGERVAACLGGRGRGRGPMNAKMPELAACVIVKNEGRYVQEWLSYHQAVGVERFIIYDNQSQDDTLAQIRAWPRQDLVTLIDWPKVPGQLPAYQHAIDNFRDVAEWCAFIDCDEFLCPQGTLSIREFLSNIGPLCAGVYAQWLMFGSSGKMVREPGPVTERFTRRGQGSFGPNCIGKSIVKMARAIGPRNPHVIRVDGRPPIAEPPLYRRESLLHEVAGGMA
jgi:glycosyltransferase involved in cell wall biosynthesis